MSSQEGARELRLVLVLGLVGGALVLWGLHLPWARFELADEVTFRAHRLVVRGSAIRSDVRAAAYAGLAGTLALLATRSWGRVVVGALVAVAGGYAAVRCGLQLHERAATFVLDDLSRRGGCPAGTGPCGPSDLHRLAAPVWGRLLGLLGGLLLLGAGGLAVVRGRRWGGLGASYDAPGAPPPPPVTEKAVWDALDRGDDPTA